MIRDNKKKLCISVGWDLFLIRDILGPVENKADITFIHALTGDASRLAAVQKKHPELRLIALGKKRTEELQEPNYTLLSKLESSGVQTVRSMIQGDPYVRYLPEKKSLGYATLIAQKLRIILEEYKPDIILASNDRLHSAMALAVAKSLDIPFVALAFPVIPDNLTGFCKTLTPNSLVPIVRPITSAIRQEAWALIQNVRAKRQNVIAYNAPFSAVEYFFKLLSNISNLTKRIKGNKHDGLDEYSSPLFTISARNIMRRTINRILLPVMDMLIIPPNSRYAYYPLHMAPESMVDTWAPFYQDQLAFVAQVALAIPADMEFVVKLHFSDPDSYSRQELKKVMRIPGVRFVHPRASGRDFLEKSSLVVGITGTSCLEAALLGKPVLIFGDSPYQHFPRTERAKKPDELHEQIISMLDKPQATDNEILEAYANYMARYMPGRINDWGRSIEPEDQNRYANCFRALLAYLQEPEKRVNWYCTTPFSEKIQNP